jgi:hypothetical protein
MEREDSQEVTETTNDNIESKAQNEPETADKAESDDSGADANEIDYKAEYERLKPLYGKTVAALKQKKDQLKSAKQELATREDKEEPEANESDIKAIIQNEVKASERMRVKDDIDEAIETATDNMEERELIRFIYENRIVPSGFSRRSIQRDIQDARLIANRERFVASAKREARAAEAEKAAMQATGSPKLGARPTKVTGQALTAEEKKFLKIYGAKVK